jgi:hypothetical protein
MKTFLTAAALITALTMTAFAEGDDPSAKSGEAKGSVKASTEQKQEPAGSNAMGQSNMAAPRATTTTGAAPGTNQLNKTETSSPANPGQKTGVTGGGDAK